MSMTCTVQSIVADSPGRRNSRSCRVRSGPSARLRSVAMEPFKSVCYNAVAPGARLIVLGAVHGNETCGTRGIERVIAELDAGSLELRAGRVTFVPVTN